MPSAVAPNERPTSPRGDNDPSYDDAVDDFMRDLEFDNHATNANVAPPAPPKDIDEEVQVKKKRKPNPKLDDTRLLSNNGIPKLRKLTRSKLKFRGKGHEYTDMTILLNMYQLWLDDLYPKAKFKDGLIMVEKVGHSKRMQITRKAWLDSTKPNRRDDSPERNEDVQMSGGLGNVEGGEGGTGRADKPDDELIGDTAQPVGTRSTSEDGGPGDAPEDDELDALLNENGVSATSTVTTRQPPRAPFEEESDAEDDELDALLAEERVVSAGDHDTRSAAPSKAASEPHVNDNFDDDEEAMASMGW